MRRPQALWVAERRHVYHAPQRYMLIPQCLDLFVMFLIFHQYNPTRYVLCCQVGFIVCGKVLTYRFVSSARKQLISKKMKKDLFLVSESFLLLLEVRLLED